MRGSTDQAADSYKFLSKPLLSGLLSFLLLAALFSLLIFQRYQLAKRSNEKKAVEIVHRVKEKLQEALNHSLAATKTLSFFISRDGEVQNFDTIAAQILETSPGIDAIQLVPDGVIKYVYPYKGNENVIGYDVLADSTRNREAFKAIEKKEMFFAGPFELRQGGMGVVGRLPVYRNNKFWGFSAVVIKMATLFREAGIDSVGKDGHYFQLSKKKPGTTEVEYFLPRVHDVKNANAVSIYVPDGEWMLSLTMSSQSGSFENIALLAIAAFFLSVFGGIFVYRVAIRPKQLNQLVLNRTRELKTSEYNYRSLIERVSDAFVSLDNNWTYTYVNQRAGELLGKKPETLLGKKMWSVFPEGVDTPFYHACTRAMQSQQYQFMDDYHSMFDKWFETHIYPSRDGITLFFRDVTEIKNVSRALKLNEEKYRSLIEQASDGIVITDLDGVILEVNKSIVELSGYTSEELIGMHVNNLLPEDDVVNNPLRINALMEGKSLLYERKVLKKDGTVSDIEVNSKMASTQTLIGFVRDISERKKNEAVLQYQAKLLQSVSDAVTSLDMNRSIVSWNKACQELYGFEEHEVIGKRIPELVKFEYPGTSNEEVFKQLRATGSWKGEFNFIHPKTGETVYLLSSINLLKDNDGQVSGFIIASKNIGERKKTEEAIKKSNERFELIGKATNDAVWEWNLETNQLWGNEVHQQLYGLTLADPVPNDAEWRKRLHPDDKERIFKMVDEALASDRNSFEGEYRLWTENKGWIHIYGSTYIERNAAGKAIRMLGNMTDITERIKAAEDLYQSEQKYKLLFYNNPLPMWMTTLPGLDIIDVNEAAIKLYGYSREEFLKLNTRALRPQEDVEKYLKEMGSMESGMINIRNWRHKKKDGTIIQVETYTHEIMYEGQRAWLALTHDVTEKYNAKELLQKSYEDIRQLVSKLQSIREDERTTIAREIHDELGQQLTGLKMDLHWLSRKIENERNDVKEKMQESIELINATIASVRKISTDLRPSILDDLGLLPALEWQGEEFEKRSGTRVEFINKAGEIVVQPEAATAIFRIYQELLTNIARHANATLVKAVLDKDEKSLYFSINDNGIGFDIATISNKKTLGLLGIKERTLLLGGTYEFKSKPGKGSVTTISIPLHLVGNVN